MKIKIDGSFYSFFDNISISFELDSIASSFSFNGYFNTERIDHRKIFKPLSYLPVEIYTNSNLRLLTGNIINTNLGSTSQRELQGLDGYSKPGILEDCTIPYEAYPLEKNKVSLKDLVNQLFPYFGLEYVVDSAVEKDMSLVYDKTTAEPSETVKSYLARLCSQRNIILTHDEFGRVVFTKYSSGNSALYHLTEQNITSISLSIQGQSFHSKITVIRQPSKENTKITPVDNSTNNLISSTREVVKILSNGTETETRKAADNLLAKELSGINFKVSLKRILNLKCGDFVDVTAPEVFLYEKTRLIVTSIGIAQSVETETMNLTLTLPEAFTGDNPKNIFI